MNERTYERMNHRGAAKTLAAAAKASLLHHCRVLVQNVVINDSIAIHIVFDFISVYFFDSKLSTASQWLQPDNEEDFQSFKKYMHATKYGHAIIVKILC